LALTRQVLKDVFSLQMSPRARQRRSGLLYCAIATQHLPVVQWSKLELTIHIHVCGTSRATTSETRYLPLDLPSKFYRLSIRSEGLYKLLTEPV